MDNKELIISFKERALSLQGKANLLLTIVVLLLIAGGIVFFNAAKITALDVSTTDTAIKDLEKAEAYHFEKVTELSSLKANIFQIDGTSQISTLEKKYQEIVNNNLQFAHNIDATVFACTPPPIGNVNIFTPSIADKENLKPSSSEFYIVSGLNIFYFDSNENKQGCISQINQNSNTDFSYKRFQQAFEEKKEKIALIQAKIFDDVALIKLKLKESEVQEKIDLIKDKKSRLKQEIILGPDLDKDSDAKSNLNDNRMSTLIQTNVTRFGSLLIVFFLVNVLLSQYRYNIRLSAFYYARADALSLEIGELTPDSLNAIVHALTPNIDFGKTPQTPIDQVIHAAKTLKMC